MTSTPAPYLALLCDAAKTATHLDPAHIAAISATGDRKLAAAIAGRDDLDPDTSAALWEHRDAAVRIAWLSSRRHSIDDLRAVFPHEQRTKVLTAVGKNICAAGGPDTVDRLAALAATAPFNTLIALLAHLANSDLRLVLAAVATHHDGNYDWGDMRDLRKALLREHDLRRVLAANANHPALMECVAGAVTTGELGARYDEYWARLVTDQIGNAPYGSVCRNALRLIAEHPDPGAAADEVARGYAGVDTDGFVEWVRHAATLTVDARGTDPAGHRRVVETLIEGPTPLSAAAQRLGAVLVTNPSIDADTLWRLGTHDAAFAGTYGGTLHTALSARQWDPAHAVELAAHWSDGVGFLTNSTDVAEAYRLYCTRDDVPDARRNEALEELWHTDADLAVTLAVHHIGLRALSAGWAPEILSGVATKVAETLSDPRAAALCGEAFNDFDGTAGDLIAALTVAYADAA